MAWHLSFQSHAGSRPAAALQHRWLTTRPPPRSGLRPQSHKQGAAAAATEHRIMALAVLQPAASHENEIYIVAASSSATLQLLRLDLSTKRLAVPVVCKVVNVSKSLLLPYFCWHH